MGSNHSRELEDDEITTLMQTTGFSRNKLNQLYVRFQRLDRGTKGYLTREDIMEIPALEINPLAERITDSFFNGGDRLDFGKFVHVLATFRPITRSCEEDHLNSRTSKLKFVFAMYDCTGDGRITKAKLLEILSMMVGSAVSAEQLKMIAERTILDSSPMSRAITFQDFEKVMTDVLVESKMVVKFQT